MINPVFNADKVVKDPSIMTRKEKLAYVTSIYGGTGEGNKFTNEIMLGRGVSRASFNQAKDKGLYVFNGGHIFDSTKNEPAKAISGQAVSIFDL